MRLAGTIVCAATFDTLRVQASADEGRAKSSAAPVMMTASFDNIPEFPSRDIPTDDTQSSN